MIAKMGRRGLVFFTVVALIAVMGFAAACGDEEATTTSVTGSTETTAGDAGSTTSTVAATDSTNMTAVVGGKTLDDYRAEIPELEKALEADPTDLSTLERLAVAHYQLKEYADAEAAYLKILAVTEDAFTRNNLGNVYRDWGKTEEAKAAYRKAMEDDPTLKYPYVNLAGVLKNEGDVEGALAVLEDGAQYVSEQDQGMLDAAEESLTTTTT